MHDLEGKAVVREESCITGCGGSATILHHKKLLLLLLVLEASYSRTYFPILFSGLKLGKGFRIKVEHSRHLERIRIDHFIVRVELYTMHTFVI